MECIIEGCIKLKHVRAGECYDHRTDKVCKEDGCSTGYYAKGWCHKHHAYNARRPRDRHVDKIKCKSVLCEKEVMRSTTWCSNHKKKINAGLSPDVLYTKGSNSHFWKGGTAEYPNHSLLKRLRLEVLASVKYRCQDCGKGATLTHHIDRDKSNHTLENLRALCTRCHCRYHKDVRGRKPRLLGKLTYREIAEHTGMSVSLVRNTLYRAGAGSGVIAKTRHKLIAETIFNA